MPSATSDILFALTGDVYRNSRALKQLRAFARAGWRVTVLSLGATDAGLRVPPGLAADVHVLPRPASSGPRFFYRVHRLITEAVRTHSARVYHASDLYVLPALAQEAARTESGLVYDARELYPHVAGTVGRPWARVFWRAIEGRYIRRADLVLTVSASIARHLAAQYRIAEPYLLHNVPEARPQPEPLDLLRERLGLPPDRVLLLHQGHIRPGRGGERLVDAMRDVEGATLVFLGSGPLRPALEARVDRDGLPVGFVDPVPPDELLPVTASADAGITLLDDSCLNHRYALPNKLFEYLMAGLPVLGAALPEVQRVIDGYGVGLTVDPADRAALVAALRRLATDGAARRAWQARIPDVLAAYSWEGGLSGLLPSYRSLLARAAPL